MLKLSPAYFLSLKTSTDDSEQQQPAQYARISIEHIFKVLNTENVTVGMKVNASSLLYEIFKLNEIKEILIRLVNKLFVKIIFKYLI